MDTLHFQKTKLTRYKKKSTTFLMNCTLLNLFNCAPIIIILAILPLLIFCIFCKSQKYTLCRKVSESFMLVCIHRCLSHASIINLIRKYLYWKMTSPEKLYPVHSFEKCRSEAATELVVLVCIYKCIIHASLNHM